MKRITAILAASGLPGAALAHPGHVELAGPMGHLSAHLVMGTGIAALAFGALVLARHLRSSNDKE